MSIDIILPETGHLATIVGRFSKEKIADNEIPSTYRGYPIISKKRKKPSQGWTPRENNRPEDEIIPGQILGKDNSRYSSPENTYGWFFCRHTITEPCLEIYDWSFYTA